jgi:hypothetical protein
MLFAVKMYVGGALKPKQIAYDYLHNEDSREDHFVRDFATDDPAWPEGYLLDGVFEGPFTLAAATELAKLLNERMKSEDPGVSYRVVEDKAEARRRSEE